MKNNYFKQLQSAVSQYSMLSENEWDLLDEIFSVSEYSKSTHIVTPNQESSCIFLVCSGLIRYYYLDDKGSEWNKAFVNENKISASFSTDFLGHTSPYGIESLENTVLLSACYSKFQSLYEESHAIERFGRLFVEQVLISKMKRERSFLQNDTKMRYLDFRNQFPSLIDRIPRYHIASYLGVTEVSLSRIRKQLDE